MIIEIEKEYSQTISEIKKIITDKKLIPDVLYGDLYTVIAVEGDANLLDQKQIDNFPGVIRSWRITSPYKSIARNFIGENHQKVTRDNFTIKTDSPDKVERIIGGKKTIFVVGPCAVESYQQLENIVCSVAEIADKHNIRNQIIIRGGAFKPRTSPFDFRGLGEEAIAYLCQVREKFGFPFITEAMSESHVEILANKADIIQIGTRNYQNFPLLEKAGEYDKPILYKRGMSAPLEEWLSAAEYIAMQGNKKIILCERGVKSTVHGDYNRSHLDPDVIYAIKERTILPTAIDISHSSGNSRLVPLQFKSALAYKPDLLMIELIADKTDRCSVKCDAKQATRIATFEKMISYYKKYSELPEIDYFN